MVCVDLEELSAHTGEVVEHVRAGGRVVVSRGQSVSFAVIGGECWEHVRQHEPRPFQNAATGVVLWRSLAAVVSGRVGPLSLTTADLEMTWTEFIADVTKARAHIEGQGGRVLLRDETGNVCALVGRDDWPQAAMFDVSPSLVEATSRRAAATYAVRVLAGTIVADGAATLSIREAVGFATGMVFWVASYAVPRRKTESRSK